MNLATETITVFNPKYDTDVDDNVWHGTVISGVSWYGHTRDTITDKGLKAADTYTIRIPVEADTGGSDYVLPSVFASMEDVSQSYTLSEGSVIVRGVAPTSGMTPTILRQTYEMLTILGVTDNRRAPHAPHFRITGV